MLDAYLWHMVYSQLADVVGAENTLTSEVDRLPTASTSCGSGRRGSTKGCRRPSRIFVVLPQSVDEVCRIVQIANQHRLPLIPCGGMSGSQGARCRSMVGSSSISKG